MAGDVGLVLGSGAVAPERLAQASSLAEELGFDEIWLAEDFFFTGGIASAAIALDATRRIRVGLGVVSAVARHPALLAMDIATLTRAHPGRLRPGVGLGVPAWVDQMGRLPRSPLSALRECVTSVKALLRGEVVSYEGRVFSFRDVRLTYPELEEVPVDMGVIGPKMLALSGEIADGSVLSVGAGLAYVKWARERIEEGRRAGGPAHRPHRITAFAIFCVDHDGDRARQAVRAPLAFYSSEGGVNALTEIAGVSEALMNMVRRGGHEVVAQEMPARWVEELTISGTPEECSERIRAFHDAGVDSVALFPMPQERADQSIEMAAAEILPLVRAG